MSPERRKLARLQRLARIREVARHQAATRAAEAEDVFARVVALDGQTNALARRYEARGQCRDAHSLRQLDAFVSGLRAMSSETARQIESARSDADARQADLASAERRKTVVEDRARDVHRMLERRPGRTASVGARRSGTVLD
ncbi:MAG: hypothetical protein KDE25_12080 [Novosphingobium sp.]|nr:hypothetical protein [Novosphingobium sp.]